MTTTTYKTYRNASFFTVATAVLLIAAPVATANADGWELRTTETEVPGTREIESGQVEKGIRYSKVQSESSNPNIRAAALNNLCIGYIVSRNFDTAEDYCNAAVDSQREKTVSYNNRGVLKALLGDFDGAMEDFENAGQAGCFGECSTSEDSQSKLPRPVAKRNHGRAIYHVQLAEQSRKERVAATTQ